MRLLSCIKSKLTIDDWCAHKKVHIWHRIFSANSSPVVVFQSAQPILPTRNSPPTPSQSIPIQTTPSAHSAPNQIYPVPYPPAQTNKAQAARDVPPPYTETTTHGSQVKPVTGNATNCGNTAQRENRGNGPIGFQQPPNFTTQGGPDGGNSGASPPEQSNDVYDEIQEYDEYKDESYAECREDSH